MKGNFLLVMLWDKIPVYRITMRKGADILSLLKTTRNLFYIRNQFVPRCKHFPPRL